MPEPEVLVFQMGLYEAEIPTHLRYSDIHFWFEELDGLTRCGLTSYAARLLGDVFRLDWAVKPGDQLADAAELGEIESTKASSELYAPMPGKLMRINSDAVNNPLQIADNPYGTWLLDFEGQPILALSPKEYLAFLAEGWAETEKLLKGQM